LDPGDQEEEGENLEQKFVEFAKDNLQEEIMLPEEIEIIHRIGKKKTEIKGHGGRGSVQFIL